MKLFAKILTALALPTVLGAALAAALAPAAAPVDAPRALSGSEPGAAPLAPLAARAAAAPASPAARLAVVLLHEGSAIPAALSAEDADGTERHVAARMIEPGRNEWTVDATRGAWTARFDALALSASSSIDLADCPSGEGAVEFRTVARGTVLGVESLGARCL